MPETDTIVPQPPGDYNPDPQQTYELFDSFDEPFFDSPVLGVGGE